MDALNVLTVDNIANVTPEMLWPRPTAPKMTVTHKVADESGMPYAVGITVECYATALGGAPPGMLTVKLERLFDGLTAFKWASNPAVLQQQCLQEALDSDEWQALLRCCETRPKHLITIS